MLVHRSREAPDRGGFLLQWVRDQIGHFVYPVHRIDRNTSGLVIFALNSEVAAGIQPLLSLAETIKGYTVMVRGRTAVEFNSLRPLTDRTTGTKKPASSQFRRLNVLGGFSLLSAVIQTGRRHQIRRHLHHLRHQVVGDSTYGKGRINRWLRGEFGLPRLFLHAGYLRIENPVTSEKIEVCTPLPADLWHFLDNFSSRFPAEFPLERKTGEYLKQPHASGDIITGSSCQDAPPDGSSQLEQTENHWNSFRGPTPGR